jgi:peptide/nickel transport system substrate-binding protein
MNPMLRTSSFVFILALLALMPSSDAEETSSEDALVVAVSSSFFMQGNVLGQGGAPSGSFVYEGLVTKNRESGYDGWLAESWESNEDATAWTFHLVEAQWHDGQPFISEDVEFTYNYITDNKMWLASVLSMVDYVDCPDERTAVFHMKSPSPAFLDDISHCPGICIIPKHIWEDIDDPDHYVDEEFVGTGPFKFVSVVPDQYVKLVANGDYYGGRPAIGEVILKIIPNKDAQILAMKSGEVDVVSEISPAVAQSIEGSNGIETFVAPETRGYELGFNLNNYPTDSLEFRKAMAHAIDREKICNIVFGGYATPTETTFLMPSVAYDFVNPDVPAVVPH